MHKNNIFLIWLLLTVTNVHAQIQTKNQIKVSINRVIDNFQKGIIEKDSILLKSLFFDKTTPIIGVMSEPTEMSIKKNNPQFEGLSVSNSSRFIKEICTSKEKQFEKFAKIEIQSQLKLAYVQFDYAFYSNGKVIQWGQENWALVFAENQWFITGINYTIRFQSIEKLPRYLME